MVLQQLRRYSAAQQTLNAIEKEKAEQIKLCKSRANDVYFQEQDKKLTQVQMQLLDLYQKEGVIYLIIL